MTKNDYFNYECLYETVNFILHSDTGVNCFFVFLFFLKAINDQGYAKTKIQRNIEKPYIFVFHI